MFAFPAHLLAEPCQRCAAKTERLERLVSAKTPAEITVSTLKRLREVATGDRIWVDAEAHSKVARENKKLKREVERLAVQQRKRWGLSMWAQVLAGKAR